jgi:hypothetical protein
MIVYQITFQAEEGAEQTLISLPPPAMWNDISTPPALYGDDYLLDDILMLDSARGTLTVMLIRTGDDWKI